MIQYDFYNKEVKRPLVFLEALPMHKLLYIKRMAEGLSQVDLANVLNCSVTMVSYMERGIKRPPLKSLAALDRYLYEDIYKDGKKVN